MPKHKEVPLFVLNGFLESGKTSLIKEIIENNPEYQDNTTVIICCEEGEVEYDSEWLDKFKVKVEYVSSAEEFSASWMEAVDKKYMADRYVIEYNAFFDWDNQEFPDYMAIYQQISIIDASTFKVMFNNMKKVYQSMLKDSSLVIFNRVDGINELSSYRRQVRAMNQQCQIAFEQSDGSLTTRLDEDLPYDITKPEIIFEEDIYPIWYVEVFDNFDKYKDKTFKFPVFVRDVLKNGNFVIGRDVMTCCAQDIQFLGYEVINNPKVKVKKGDFIYLDCKIVRQYSKLAGDTVIMIDANSITILPSHKEEVLGMN